MKRLIRILPIFALLFTGISRIWWRSVGTVAATALTGQQSGVSRTQYVYDDNGRLTMVISSNDEAVSYSYDSTGNITSIARPTGLQLISFSPQFGSIGTQVTFLGIGFAGGVSSVSFNGTPSTSVQVNAPSVVATVPTGATTGMVTITTPQGTVTTSTPFTVNVGS